MDEQVIQSRIAELTALLLCENGAVKINLETPFKLASGNFSPIYINCRQVLSDRQFMKLFTAFAGTILQRDKVEFDMIAGGETAGIPFAAYLAHALDKPMLYVRKKAKGYGLAAKVEGGNPAGHNVLLVEDLITDAGSKLEFIESLQAAKATVSHVMVLFDRGQGGGEVLAKHAVKLLSLTNLETTLEATASAKFITKSEYDSVQNYLKDPKAWHDARGLQFVTQAG